MSSLHRFIEAQSDKKSAMAVSESGAKQVAESTIQMLDSICNELAMVYESIERITSETLVPSSKLRRRSALMRVSQLQIEVIEATKAYKEFVESK